MVNTANYLRNRCFRGTYGRATAYELWHGKLPNFKQLKILKFKAFVLDKLSAREEFDNKSVKEKIVGHTTVTKAFRQNDLGKIIEAIGISFIDE